MDKMIVTVLLIVAGVVMSAMVVNTVVPVIHRSSSDLVGVADSLDDRIQSDIQIIQVVGELNSAGSFVDTDGDGRFDIFVWVKNIGKTRIDSIGDSDVFYGTTGDYQRVPYDAVEGAFPCWHYHMEGGATEWGISDTCRMELTFTSAESAGTYWVKVILPNGISSEHDFSM